jgi:hypothetical protein
MERITSHAFLRSQVPITGVKATSISHWEIPSFETFTLCMSFPRRMMHLFSHVMRLLVSTSAILFPTVLRENRICSSFPRQTPPKPLHKLLPSVVKRWLRYLLRWLQRTLSLRCWQRRDLQEQHLHSPRQQVLPLTQPQVPGTAWSPSIATASSRLTTQPSSVTASSLSACLRAIFS